MRSVEAAGDALDSLGVRNSSLAPGSVAVGHRSHDDLRDGFGQREAAVGEFVVATLHGEDALGEQHFVLLLDDRHSVVHLAADAVASVNGERDFLLGNANQRTTLPLVVVKVGVLDGGELGLHDGGTLVTGLLASGLLGGTTGLLGVLNGQVGGDHGVRHCLQRMAPLVTSLSVQNAGTEERTVVSDLHGHADLVAVRACTERLHLCAAPRRRDEVSRPALGGIGERCGDLLAAALAELRRGGGGDGGGVDVQGNPPFRL